MDYHLELRPDGTTASIIFWNPTNAELHAFSLHRAELAEVAKQKTSGQRPTIERPRRRRPLPDEFYREIAAAYVWAVANHEKPLKSLTEQTGKPRTTVARWVKEARRRGHLATGQTGKVTV